MRQQTLHRRVQYGAAVGVLFLVALPLASLAGIRGVEAIRDGVPSTAIVSWLMSLGTAVVPVVALAIYLHWLSATDDTTDATATEATGAAGAAAPTDAAAQREMHVPTRSEDWLLGIGTALVVLAGVPILSFAYHGSVDARASGELAFAIGYGVLGLAYLVFAGFCVERYVQWMR